MTIDPGSKPAIGGSSLSGSLNTNAEPGRGVGVIVAVTVGVKVGRGVRVGIIVGVTEGVTVGGSIFTKCLAIGKFIQITRPMNSKTRRMTGRMGLFFGGLRRAMGFTTAG